MTGYAPNALQRRVARVEAEQARVSAINERFVFNFNPTPEEAARGREALRLFMTDEESSHNPSRRSRSHRALCCCCSLC